MANVKATIDGKAVEVPAGTTIFDAARAARITIPTLCHQQNETPVAVCRVCVVEVKGARVYPAACIRPVDNNMEIMTASPGIQQARKTLLELLLADHPVPCTRQARNVFRSAWIPAPPPESEPAMVNAVGGEVLMGMGSSQT